MEHSPGLAAAKDLTGEPPRGFDQTLQGYAMLPRTLDKARATLAGTAGSYQFGCPVDHTLLARLGIAPELLLDLAARHAADDDVLDALRAHGIPTAEQAWFDAQAVEDEIVGNGPYLRVRAGDALASDGPVRRFAGAEHGAAVDIALIDAPAGFGERSHTHAGAEVVVVTAGAATYFLSAAQARIVRAGEVLRVPAGVEHRFAVHGEAAFRAIAVLPADIPR